MKAIYIIIIVLLIIFIIYLFHAYRIREITPKGEVIRPEETFAVMIGSHFNRKKVFFHQWKRISYFNFKERRIL